MTRFSHSLWPLVWLLAATAVVLAGCDIPERPLLKPVRATKSMPEENPLNETDLESIEPPLVLDQPSWETWDAYFVDNQQIGYSHAAAQPTSPTTYGSVHYSLDHRIYRQQGDARILQRTVLSSNESKEGRLLEFEATRQVGLAVTRFAGTMGNGKLVIESHDGSSSELREIPWELNYRGLFAIEQSLRANPLLTTGEMRTIKMLLIGQYKPATARLRCSGPAVVPLIDGSEAELIEINTEITVEGSPPIHSAIWTDATGEIKRTYSPGMNMISYRTDRERATAIDSDDLVPVALKVSGELDRPSETTRVAFRITPLGPPEDWPSMEFAKLPGQYVRTSENGITDVLVSRRIETPAAGFETDQPPATEEDYRNNYFVDSRAEIVKKFADAALQQQEITKLQAAAELTETANRVVRFEPHRFGLAKASSVARVAEGNSLQKAIFLAALMRAHGIPSRIAVGLKYDPATGRMVSHVWTVGFDDDRWAHFDAVDGVPAAADRLAFHLSNLGEQDENDAFAPLMDRVRRIQIKILAAKYGDEAPGVTSPGEAAPANATPPIAPPDEAAAPDEAANGEAANGGAANGGAATGGAATGEAANGEAPRAGGDATTGEAGTRAGETTAGETLVP